MLKEICMSRNLWEFVYEPKKFEMMILNDTIKGALKEAFDTRPNMLIYGPPGVGKGTFVNILMNHHNLQDFTLKINASEETGIDSIREKVKSFAQAMSIGTMKLVYLNEADSLTSGPQGAQKMLRDLMEQTKDNTQYILACNYEQYIIPEIKSRCQSFNIAAPPADKIFKYCKGILTAEKIEFDPKSLVQLVKKCYPDIRNTFITMRQNVSGGKLADTIVQSASEELFNKILMSMNKDPGEVRKILKSNSVHYEGLYEHLYEHLMDESDDRIDIFNDEAQAVIHIGESAYKSSIVANKEIEFMRMYFRMIQDKTIVI
jgi:replication-associated recombination protein RarA